MSSKIIFFIVLIAQKYSGKVDSWGIFLPVRRENLNLLWKAAELTNHSAFANTNCHAGANCSVCFLQNTPIHSFVMFWYLALVTFASDTSNKLTQLQLRLKKTAKKTAEQLTRTTANHVETWRFFTVFIWAYRHAGMTNSQSHQTEEMCPSVSQSKMASKPWNRMTLRSISAKHIRDIRKTTRLECVKCI